MRSRGKLILLALSMFVLGVYIGHFTKDREPIIVEISEKTYSLIVVQELRNTNIKM